MSVRKYKARYWALYDEQEILIAVCVYKKGAEEVKRRLSLLQASR